MKDWVTGLYIWAIFILSIIFALIMVVGMSDAIGY